MTSELSEFRKGNIRTLSRLISRAENLDESLYETLSELYPDTKATRVIGVTGPPGAGKSSLISDFVRRSRGEKRKVAVLAVDPISPFTGGALLGDRIRLLDHFNDPQVFIRSLSTRGKLGGLSLASREVIHLCTAFGFDDIFVETVGVGQSEVEIKGLADLTLVVLTPESGDGIQTMKAGILEIADLFVVNKFDRAGGTNLLNELKSMVHLSPHRDVPVLATTQQDPKTIDDLYHHLTTYFSSKEKPILERREARRQLDFGELLKRYLEQEVARMPVQNTTDNSNPYRAFLQFRKKHPPGSLLK